MWPLALSTSELPHAGIEQIDDFARRVFRRAWALSGKVQMQAKVSVADLGTRGCSGGQGGLRADQILPTMEEGTVAARIGSADARARAALRVSSWKALSPSSAS